MSSHIQKSCVGLEATLSDSKKKYGDKVNALLSAWEHVTNFIPAATPEGTQSLIEWVHKHTLKLVLRGEWPKLSPATKTHLCVTLQRCATHLVHHPAAPRCIALIALVNDPWSRPGLDSILNGQPDSENEDEFCCSEKGELLTMRLKILCEDRCEDIAIKLAAACVRSLRRSDRLRSVSDPHHVNFMLDVYIVLLYKLKRMQDILAQLKLMDLNDALELVQRLSGEKPTKYGTARVWRNSIKAAELVAQYLVTAGMVRPVAETGANVLEQILNSWAMLHSKLKDISSTLPGMIRKLIEPAESAQHMYIFCAVLLKHFGESVKPFVIELYVRALTTDMNELENQKAKSDREKVRETSERLSGQFLKLADVVDNNIGIARECVLTAFSLHPTRACYDRIIEMAVACGKAKQDVNETDVTGDKVKSDNNENDNILEETTTKNSVKRTSATSPSMLTSSHVNACKNSVELQNGVPKTFERNDQLLKNLLKSPRKSDSSKAECHSHTKKDHGMDVPLGELCFNCGEFAALEEKKSIQTNAHLDRSLDALILINGDVVTGSANYDEKSVPNHMLDAEKLGLTPQLCDDLAVVLSSPRYHMLSWVLDWKELHALCERYLENAEEMGNTNKELKYLNIDYSQFKDWPSEDDNTKDVFFGIEKGYEQWVDLPSDGSEQFGSFQPAGGYKRSSTRRSLDDTTDSDSGSVMRVRRTGRQRKAHRLESSESDYESAERKRKNFRNSTSSVSDTDTNTQDSQTDSLGSDGCRRDNKTNDSSPIEMAKKREKSKLTVESVSHFHMLVNENIRHTAEDVSSSDVSSNDIITLFAADMDENKRETIKGSTYTAAAPLIITEKRSDPAVLKSLRMFRPQNAKKPTRMAQILQKNILNKSKEANVVNNNTGNVAKFAPMLSTLNLNPKIVLTRADEIDRKLMQTKKPQLSAGDISSELINIQKTMPFSPHKNAIGSYHKRKGDPNEKVRGSRPPRNRRAVKSNLGKNKYDILAKAVRDSDILAKNVPGLNSLDMMVPPRVHSTVNVVQLSRNIPQSPNSGSVNSGNTPPRNRTSSIAGNIQLPGTPSSGGHDSGVGLSPAGQTPPPRSSGLHDVGDEANQPPDNSPTSSTNASTTESDSPRGIVNQRTIRNDSPTKSPSPSAATMTTTLPITSEQLQIVCKPDGTYQLASINANIIGNQRNLLTRQNLEENAFPRQMQQRVIEAGPTIVNRNAYERSNSVKLGQQSGQNAGLPKFQQAFRKAIYTLSSETGATTTTMTGTTTTTATTTTTTTTTATTPTTTATTTTTTVGVSSSTDTLVQHSSVLQKTTNLSKAVQTSVPNAQTNSGINVQSITNIQNRSLTPGTRQILNIVQSSNVNANSQSSGQTLAQLVQSAPSGGVIYTHKIPVTISTTTSQLNIIPSISHTNSLSGGRTPVVKLNIIRAGTPLRQQHIAEAIQAALAAPRMQQQQQQQQQQSSQTQSQQATRANVRTEALINTTIEVPNQVSSTTLEQLREFESVLEQVKERSTIQPQLQSTANASSSSTTTTVQTQTTSQQTQGVVVKQHQQQTAVSALAQQLLIPTQSPTSTEFTTNGGNTVAFQQQDVFSQKVSLAYVNQSGSTTPQKVANSTPVVVVTSYCQPAASPALSVTSQSSSSPCVTPAPPSTPSAGKTPPTPSPKSSKKFVAKSVKTNAAASTAAKASPIPKPQQKPQEDEQTAQRIYTILAQYAEQLRNSPDLNNKPAPRRRSNPPTNPSQSSKRKKSGSSKSKPAGPQASEMSPGTEDLGRTMGSEDSSSGIVHVQDSPAGYPSHDEAPVTSNVVETSSDTRNLTSDSNDGIEISAKRRNLIFTEPGSGQTRAVIVQEAVQSGTSVSVSEALASVTGKIGSTAVLMPTNYLLPMNIVKGGQQFTIVSSNSKLLATVPTSVRTSGATGVSNTLVLQSILNPGKIISQPGQMKQVKLPSLQTISASQTLNAASSVQNASVVVPHSSASTQFTGDANLDKSGSVETVIAKNDAVATSVTSSETNTIIVNKTSAIGLLQRNINDIGESQQICGVITSNPNLTLQGARLFNSTIAKLSTANAMKTESVVCLAPASTITHTNEKKTGQEHQGTQSEKSVTLQGQTIALAFAAQSNVALINNSQQQHHHQQAKQQQQKETKEASTEITSSDKVISPKTVKRKMEDSIGVGDNIARTLVTTNSIVSPCIVTSLQSNAKLESVPVPSAAAKQASTTTTASTTASIENAGQYIVSGAPGNSDSQESQLRQTTEAIEACKVGNGIMCGNARLQEAWEPERKSSPDTPWRYVPAATNQMAIEPLKVYTRENENSDVHSVLQIINKGQGAEMASGQVYQTSVKKYFLNHTLEPFQQYPNKVGMAKSHSNQRLDRELLQQKMERKAAAIERELRLQKSLSEECEDLGVDEPSTSDLFPEADLLFDTNHSPSFDHSSQDASCSQPLGMKLYNASYFRPLDSSSGSRDTSPVPDFKLNERRKNAAQRTRNIKDTMKRTKREKIDEMQIESPAKHIRLSMDNLSQDEASNSNSDLSRSSPARITINENESSKEATRMKIISRNGSKEGSPSSVSSIPSNMKLDIDMDSESLPPVVNVNNASAVSSGDESLTLMSTNNTDVTIPSPLSPIAGPLLSTHKYTYTNKKRATTKVLRAEYLSWESPMSERTRSSSDDEDSSISESMSSQAEDNTVTNGLDDIAQSGNQKSIGDRCTYVKKQDKLQVNARVVLNRAETKSIVAKRLKNDSINESGVISSDRASEASDDEICHAALIEPDCRARRSSLRGHVKKGCACCNGSPERPKKKTTLVNKTSEHKMKKKITSKQLAKKR